MRSDGAKGDGGERDRQQWEKEKRDVGTVERRDVAVPYSGAVELDCHSQAAHERESKMEQRDRRTKP